MSNSNSISQTSPDTRTDIDDIYYEHAMSQPLARRLTVYARRKMFEHFLDVMRPKASDTIIDFGASETETEEANMLEKQYPHVGNITCVGLGDGQQILAANPGVNYQSVAPFAPLPFGDDHFDIAYSNAVFEHLGSHDNRLFILRELARVAKKVYITIPNRWFPVEHHTAVPLLHFHPGAFRSVTKRTGLKHWAEEDALQFLSAKDLRRLFDDAGLKSDWDYVGLKMGIFSSNISIWA